MSKVKVGGGVKVTSFPKVKEQRPTIRQRAIVAGTIVPSDHFERWNAYTECGCADKCEDYYNADKALALTDALDIW